eukprot:scaffold47261_cov53-Cyclotella_meneghiniana.AAC.3
MATDNNQPQQARTSVFDKWIKADKRKEICSKVRGSSPLPPEIQSRVQKILTIRRVTSTEAPSCSGPDSNNFIDSIKPTCHIIVHNIFISGDGDGDASG